MNTDRIDPDAATPSPEKVDTQVGPRGSLELLSQREMTALTDESVNPTMLAAFRRCALAVLNTGNETDDATALFEAYRDFSIEVAKRTRGLKLVIRNASAFVEGRMVEGIRQHLFSTLRDIVYIGTEVSHGFDLTRGDGITDAVFHLLKQGRVLDPNLPPRLVVCWGGHSISRTEYDYSKEVGYHLGLRGFDICTGCGPGAMKGPMKGAAVGHAKQRVQGGRFVGLTEPGIIAAEPPNPMVSHLVILPDIEKRLEAFVRLGHAILVFPGGAGTAEEVLYLLGILSRPDNARIVLPVLFTGPPESAGYFQALDAFLAETLGEAVRERYRIVVGNAEETARILSQGMRRVRKQRRRDGDAYYFNWLLNVPDEHQQPFDVSHESVSSLTLSSSLPTADMAVNLRRLFSAIVAGNVKDAGQRIVRERGPFEIHADPSLLTSLDALLESFVAQGRMKLPGSRYEPCYRVTAG